MNQLCAIAEIRIDAGINDPHLDSSSTAQHIDGGPASQKVVNHLRRDFARIGTNAFDSYTVIPSDNIDAFASDARDSLLNRGKSVSDLFRDAPGCRWFWSVSVVARGLHSARIDRPV
jgi:hypothetical protein